MRSKKVLKFDTQFISKYTMDLWVETEKSLPINLRYRIMLTVRFPDGLISEIVSKGTTRYKAKTRAKDIMNNIEKMGLWKSGVVPTTEILKKFVDAFLFGEL